MRKRKIFLITGLFLLALTGLRLIWIHFHGIPDHPPAVQGVLDLRHESLENLTDQTIPLEGEWEFYPNVLLKPGEVDTASVEANKKMIQVPSNRNPFLSTGKNSYSYGSYRLRILVPHDEHQSYGFLVPSIHTASRLLVDGHVLGSSGSPAETYEEYIPRRVPYSANFTADRDEIDLVIHVANDAALHKDGFDQLIKFGTAAAVNQQRSFSIAMQLLVCVVLVLHGIYTAILYLLGKRQKALLCFLFLIICTTISVLVDDDKLLLVWLPISYEWDVKLYYLFYNESFALLVQTTKYLTFEFEKKRVVRWFLILCRVYSLFILFAPAHIIFMTDLLSFAPALFSLLIVPVMVFRYLLKAQDGDGIFLLLAAAAIASSAAWGIIKNLFWMEMPYYPFDFIASFLGFATFWFKRYLRNADQTAKLALQLQTADKQKDDFLANTSHELRNPLHGIINMAQSVMDNGKKTLDEKNKKNLQLLITVGHRMAQMLNDLLDLSRIREGKINLQPSNIQIQSVASGVLDMLRFLTEGKPIQFEMKIPDTFPPVVADEKRLIQILFNLLHNAVKYTSEGSVTISAEMRNGKGYIHISDTGIGMDEETQHRVFQPYEQGDSSITAIGGGFGLGLSICQRLVELHGGTLKVNSTPGQGSIFTFTLPLADPFDQKEISHFAASTEQANAIAEVASGLADPLPVATSTSAASRPKILAVDDDPVNLKILGSILPTDQYEIETATNGKEAISKLDDKPWDLVIADVMMPHMSGYELTRIIRQRFSILELPVLLLTARSRSEDVSTGFLSGANDYVTKPVDAVELKARIRALTDLKQSVSERLRMEAAYLQAQIKPHFLFNTLNSITALSSIDKARMYDLINAFSEYLRKSFDFSNSEQVVPIKHELDLVRSYLYIEKERFGDKLDISWEVDPNINLQLPPLTIQPLVENAVRHGILSRSKGGMVRIRISDSADCIEIAIEDNGVGMDEKKVGQLLDSHVNEKRGIGLLNTDRRLKQRYGKGLIIRSKPGQGTTVSFEIPKKRWDGNDSSHID